jgi:3D-(3,5/4)-trihydroxycyclohexane-1,2-dione acylhydrolase (decyclizing)
MNSEIATSAMLGAKLIVVVLDNRGYGCIERLQAACGGASFNNLLDGCVAEGGHDVRIDFAAHAAALGAQAVHASDLPALREALVRARAASRTQVIVVDTTHARTTADGGAWWEVGVPEVSTRAEVEAAAAAGREAKRAQRP